MVIQVCSWGRLILYCQWERDQPFDIWVFFGPSSSWHVSDLWINEWTFNWLHHFYHYPKLLHSASVWWENGDLKTLEAEINFVRFGAALEHDYVSMSIPSLLVAVQFFAYEATEYTVSARIIHHTGHWLDRRDICVIVWKFCLPGMYEGFICLRGYLINELNIYVRFSRLIVTGSETYQKLEWWCKSSPQGSLCLWARFLNMMVMTQLTISLQILVYLRWVIARLSYIWYATDVPAFSNWNYSILDGLAVFVYLGTLTVRRDVSPMYLDAIYISLRRSVNLWMNGNQSCGKKRIRWRKTAPPNADTWPISSTAPELRKMRRVSPSKIVLDKNRSELVIPSRVPGWKIFKRRDSSTVDPTQPRLISIKRSFTTPHQS